MSVSAQVVDGKIVTSSSESSLASNSNSSTGVSSTLDKNAFLQLLVAQMKYQDPLEPTTNTEYISQFATFSELEEMQNMSLTMELSRVSALVGEEVIIETTDASGNTSYVRGPVDYVQMEGGKAYLSILGSLYSSDDIYSVVDEKYLDAYDKATALIESIKALPTVGNVTLSDKDAITAISKTYEGMDDYQKSFIASEVVATIKEYTDKLADLITVSGGSAGEE